MRVNMMFGERFASHFDLCEQLRWDCC